MYRKDGKVNVMRLNGVFRSTSRENSPDRGGGEAERRSGAGEHRMQGLERGRAPSRNFRGPESNDASPEQAEQEVEDEGEGDDIEVDENDDDEDVSMDVEENMNVQEHECGGSSSLMNQEDRKTDAGTKRRLDGEAGPSAKISRQLSPSDGMVLEEGHPQENSKTAEGTPPSRKSARIAIRKGSSQPR